MGKVIFLLTVLVGSLLVGCMTREIGVQAPIPSNRVVSNDSRHSDEIGTAKYEFLCLTKSEKRVKRGGKI